MPKKSNKTAHVLSLLTNSNDETLEEDFIVPKSNPESNSVSKSSEPAKPKIIIELQGTSESDSLSNLVKSDLEKELNEQLAKKNNSPSFCDGEKEDSDSSQRLPYSATFMSKFGVGLPQKKEIIKDKIIEEDIIREETITTVSSNLIKSQVYILENFNDEDKEIEPMESNKNTSPTNNISPTHAVPADESICTENIKELHNLAEDFMKIKAPEIMQNFDMCTCQECIYDVMTLALNHTQPLYTVSEKGKLFQKLNAYELQYGTDLASQITKACITVKLNPRHPNLNKK